MTGTGENWWTRYHPQHLIVVTLTIDDIAAPA
jgi:hypothetical protein